MNQPLSEKIFKPQSPQEWTQWAKILLRPRMFFESKFYVPSENSDEKGSWRSATYRRRHLDPTIRGKLKIKAAKRARVKAMKEAQKTL